MDETWIPNIFVATVSIFLAIESTFLLRGYSAQFVDCTISALLISIARSAMHGFCPYWNGATKMTMPLSIDPEGSEPALKSTEWTSH